ncbi:hypothetical protein C2E20_6303 [Micractinium conductrix]|uniref:Uncharacterized protein n=1 Tax=Micractinium conductrix TaxID=554055 RepID=A0A2P6V818_9CHLO|nr:hypothetical protein C2E20_6303 [Micractinium conductrix]|eukprot:PSC70223.1 hypothetical protein C2E20_6303 [Micractinium conductrix]
MRGLWLLAGGYVLARLTGGALAHMTGIFRRNAGRKRRLLRQLEVVEERIAIMVALQEWAEKQAAPPGAAQVAAAAARPAEGAAEAEAVAAEAEAVLAVAPPRRVSPAASEESGGSGELVEMPMVEELEAAEEGTAGPSGSGAAAGRSGSNGGGGGGRSRSAGAGSAGADPSGLSGLKAYVVGWLQACVLVARSARQARSLPAAAVTESNIASPGLLLCYRAAALGWALIIGLCQLANKGPYVFVFFTVWNWWLLTLYFALASAASARAWLACRQQQQAAETPAAQQQRAKGGRSADWLERAAVAVFCTETPVTLAIDFLTWFVLVPMLMADPSAQRVQFWEERIFNFESYNQHGFNAVMMLGDLVLNQIPVTMTDAGWLALWGSLFGLWSGLFYHRTNRFIYPFLDAHKPYAWASYLGVFGVLWVAFLLFWGAARARTLLLVPRSRARKAAAAAAGGGARGAAAAPASAEQLLEARGSSSLQPRVQPCVALVQDKMKVG